MSTGEWFNEVPVIGSLPPQEAAAKLRELGEENAAEILEGSQRKRQEKSDVFAFEWPFQNRPWQHTSHSFGFIAPSQDATTSLPIQHAGSITADNRLKNSRIKITLDQLRIADYPGGGRHCVLFDFYAQNQLPGKVEHLHFNMTCRVNEGEQAAVLGYPIFVGLQVGTDGVSFKCFTINVKNENDEEFLAFMDSDVFKTGLRLTSTLQPAIAPLSGMVVALTTSIARRNRNVPVQDFYMGLDFTTISTRARLAEGSYIAVQIPETMQIVWDWDEWVYNSSRGRIVNKNDPSLLIPYNYLVFSVSKYEKQ